MQSAPLDYNFCFLFLVMETIESHLMRDLEAARKYGIEPQEILQDLRQKHSNHS